MYCSKRYLLAAWLAVGLLISGCEFDLTGPGEDAGEQRDPGLHDVFNDRLPLADSPDRIFCDLSNFVINMSTVFEPDLSTEVETGCGLRLTESEEMQAVSVYLKKPLRLADDASFRSRFSFRIHDAGGTEDEDGPGADGFVFVLQSAGDRALGAGGGFLGYGGILSNVGIEFDTYSNHGQHRGDTFINDSDGNHVGINVDGFPESLETAVVPTRLNNGEVWWAWIDYDGQNNELSVRLSETQERPNDALLSAEIDLPDVLGGTAAWVGFTAATGGGYQKQDILSWQFRSGGQSVAGEATS